MTSSKKLFSLSSPHGPGGVFFAWQRTSGGFLATTGYNQSVNIYNRHAELVSEIHLKGMCCCFGWDKDGDLLAVINDKSSDILLWDANNKKSLYIDSGIRDPLNILIWAKKGPTMAIGSYRGNLMIYNHKTSRRVPIIGKHSKSITCGSWSNGGMLALGSEDRTLSINNSEGDTIRVATLRAEPSEVRFSEMKQDERSTGGENTVSLIVGGKTLYLFNLFDPENPIELAFQARYGSIVTYDWFGDGYILIGFSAGFFVVISTHMKEIGQELFQIKNHKESLTDIAVSTPIGKAASCGDNSVKIHELHDLKETTNVLRLDDERSLESVSWSEDGQLLAVSTSKGNLHVFLSKLPLLGSAYQSRVAYLTSLSEITITNVIDEDDVGIGKETTLVTEVEPSFLSLGPYNLAVGMNNRVWFYSVSSDNSNPEFIKDREYLGSVQEIHLNSDYCAVRFDGGKLQLHVLEGSRGEDDDDEQGNIGEDESRDSKLFPETGKNQVISCHYLSPDFLIYGTDMGEICFFFLEDWVTINDFKHNTGIKSMYPEPNGTKIIFIDSKSQGYLYNPTRNSTLLIKEFPEGIVRNVIWDHNNNLGEERSVFVAYDGKERLYGYSVYPDDIYADDDGGLYVLYLGETKIPQGQFPVLLFDGEVSLQSQSGKLVKLSLSSHEMGSNLHDYSNEELEKVVDKNVALGRFKNAWAVCQVLDDPVVWKKLGEDALRKLEIDFAVRVYRHIGDASIVWAIEEIRKIEDKKLLSGHIAMILGEYDLAQSLYLRSGSPVESLKMRRDLLQWDQALKLADKLASKEIPYISKEYAQQLEFTGDYPGALTHYEKGLIQNTQIETSNHEEHNLACKMGISRTAIRCGDVRKGIKLCSEIDSRQLKKECGDILESIKQYSEAARLYEAGNYYDKAAYLYIKLKNWSKIGELLPHISSPKIQLQYAKAKESDGKYREAAKAYEAGRDYDNAVRVYLDHLEDPESAVRLVKSSGSTEGAKSVARFFLKLNDYDSAIRFLILSECVDEAFQLAQRRGKMELFSDIVGDDASPEDYASIALYFESQRNYLRAGKFYHKAGQNSKALRHLLKVSSSTSSESEALDLAVKVVASNKSNDHHLFRQLVDFLLGETDGIPKDAKYLFRLYMARGLYKEAGKTAVIIAREEQTRGNYRNAHDVLYNMYSELRERKIPIPSEMRQNLSILHSYLIARRQIKFGEHLSASRNLSRVAKHISKFPSHIVPILTSTVIECSRSGLKNSAFQYATTLMRPEYRTEIDSKYVKKIESVVRKRSREEEPMPDSSPCPYCSNDVPDPELYCSRCKRVLPYCVLSGFHVTREDVRSCPQCKFPGFNGEFEKLITKSEPCLMCGCKITVLSECEPYRFEDVLVENEEEDGKEIEESPDSQSSSDNS